MNEDVFDSEYSNVRHVVECNAVLLTWKKKCSFADYRRPATFAMEQLAAHPRSNLIIDARNGFEDEKEDVEWGFSVLLPGLARTDCRMVVLVMREVNEIEAEMDMWTKEFLRYFAVKKVSSLAAAVDCVKGRVC